MSSQLTPEQEAINEKYRVYYGDLALSTEPVNRELFNEKIRQFRREMKIPEPKDILWFKSLPAGSEACEILAAIPHVYNANVRYDAKDKNYQKALYENEVLSECRKSLMRAVNVAELEAKEPGKTYVQIIDECLSAWVNKKHNVPKNELEKITQHFFGGRLWGGWNAFIKVSQEFGDDMGTAVTFHDASVNVGYWWNCEDIVIATDPPTSLKFDESNSPHCEDDYAIKYGDGRGVCVWHGRKVPEKVIFAPNDITAEDIANEKNAEVRRIMRERMGDEKYIQALDVVNVHKDEISIGGNVKGTLKRLLVKTRDCEEAFLISNDSSTERVYYMSVDPESKNCAEAHKSICGFDEEDILANS